MREKFVLWLSNIYEHREQIFVRDIVNRRVDSYSLDELPGERVLFWICKWAKENRMNVD